MYFVLRGDSVCQSLTEVFCPSTDSKRMCVSAGVGVCERDMVPEHGKQQKCSSNSEGEVDGSFVFEAQEAWKDFHNSLRQFYENGELCDVTLKVRNSVRSVSQSSHPKCLPFLFS